MWNHGRRGEIVLFLFCTRELREISDEHDLRHADDQECKQHEDANQFLTEQRAAPQHQRASKHHTQPSESDQRDRGEESADRAGTDFRAFLQVRSTTVAVAKALRERRAALCAIHLGFSPTWIYVD